MPIIGNSILEVGIKIDSEKGGNIQGVQINPQIKSMEMDKINKKEVLVIKCNFYTTYLKNQTEPLARFMVSERIIFSGDKKEMKEILKNWEKENKIPEKYEEGLIQGISNVCMYDLQTFTNHMRLPQPIGFKFPEKQKKKVKKGKKKKGKK